MPIKRHQFLGSTIMAGIAPAIPSCAQPTGAEPSAVTPGRSPRSSTRSALSMVAVTSGKKSPLYIPMKFACMAGKDIQGHRMKKRRRGSGQR